MKTKQIVNEFSILYKDEGNCIKEIRGFESEKEAIAFFNQLNTKYNNGYSLIRIKNFTNCIGKTIIPNLDNY